MSGVRIACNVTEIMPKISNSPFSPLFVRRNLFFLYLSPSIMDLWGEENYDQSMHRMWHNIPAINRNKDSGGYRSPFTFRDSANNELKTLHRDLILCTGLVRVHLSHHDQQLAAD